MKSFFFLIAAAALAAGCNSTAAKTDNTATSGEPARSGASGRNGTEIMVTLTGGPNAGTYHASSKESSCSMGLTGEKSFGNQYSETGKGDKELSSVQVIADDYDEAKKGTAKFTTMIQFGKLLSGASYNLNPDKGDGTGTLTITESGSGRTATIEGKTKDGVGIKAVVTCNTIQKVVDGQLKEE